jgi:hypothetical protein
MEILSPLFAVVVFLCFIGVCKKTYQVFLIYRSRKNLNDIFYRHFQFFLDQAVSPYGKTLFSEGHQQEISRLENMTWQEIASLCNLEMNPSWHTGKAESIYKSNKTKSIILNRVKSDLAQSNPEVQYQLCIFFEKVLPLVEQLQEDADDLGHLMRIKIVKKLFENYANAETQAKFEKRTLSLIVEEE